MTEPVAVNFKTPAETREWLEKRAAANHRSLTGEINFILEQAKAAETQPA